MPLTNTRKPKKKCKVIVNISTKDLVVLQKIAYESGNTVQSVIRHLLWEESKRRQWKNP